MVELQGTGPQRLCLCCYWFQDEVYAVFSPVKISTGARMHQIKHLSDSSIRNGNNDIESSSTETFLPSAVFVLKTSSGSGKVFVNIMHHTNIPMREASYASVDENGSSITDTSNPIILSRGPRSSVDKKKNVCIVYDAMVNSKVIAVLSRNETQLFCEAIFRHLESKYNTLVDKSIVIPSISGNYKDGPIHKTSLALLMATNNSGSGVNEESKNGATGSKSSLATIFPSATENTEASSSSSSSSSNRMSSMRSLLKFMPSLVLKTKRETTGGKVFINILRGWIEEEGTDTTTSTSEKKKYDSYEYSSMFKFTSESPGFILASKHDPKACSYSAVPDIQGDYAVYDIILCENLFKCIQSNQETFSDYIFRSIILHIGRVYGLPDLKCATYSFPKFKFKQYKSLQPFDEENNQVLVSEDQCDFMSILSVATVSDAELTYYLNSMAPRKVKLMVQFG